MKANDTQEKTRTNGVYRKAEFEASGGYDHPGHQSPWQEYFRGLVEPFSEGMVLRGATKYQSIAKKGMPRDNH